MSYRSANPFSVAGLLRRLAPVAERLPRAYLISLSVLAAAGYGILFAIPLAMIVSLSGLISLLYPWPAEMTPTAWLSSVGMMATFVYTSALSMHLLRMKLPLPKGLLLKTEKLPAFKTLLQKCHEHFQIQSIERVIITEAYELHVAYTPRWGWPVWATPTLCIGLPVMQCLSPKHFHNLLAGQIGQHAAPYSRWLHQLNKLRSLYGAYNEYYGQNKNLLTWPLAIFFKLYTPVYRSLSIYTAHWDELEADRYSLELFSDQEVLEAMLTSTACQQYLRQCYWAKIIKRLQNHSPRECLPHAHMAEEVRRTLASGKINVLLQQAFDHEFDGRSNTIPLRKRMENIGYEKLKTPSVLIKNAAHEFLGTTQQRVIAFMDKLWFSRNLPRWKKQQKRQNRKQSALNYLNEQSYKRALSEHELWRQARLMEKLHGENAALPIYKKLLQKNIQHARGLFGYGRILLRRGNNAGVKALEQAMALETNFTPKACILIFKFLMKHGQKQRALLYRNRALSFNQQSAA